MDEQPTGTDGWLEGPPPVTTLPARRGDFELEPPASEEADTGKAMAVLSHASIFFGVPLFLIPLCTRDNAFALHHGKAAAVNFGFMMVSIFFTVLSCGLLFPLIFFSYVPAIVGIIHASNGELAGPFGWGPAGERVLAGVKTKPRQLT